MAETRVRLNGQTRTTLVVFGEEATLPLLGAYTLEGFGLAADPVNRRLVPVPGLLKWTCSQRLLTIAAAALTLRSVLIKARPPSGP